MGKECHRVYFEALKKRSVCPKLKIEHKYKSLLPSMPFLSCNFRRMQFLR